MPGTGPRSAAVGIGASRPDLGSPASRDPRAFVPVVAAGEAVGVSSFAFEHPREFNEADREAFVAASKPVYDQFAEEVEGGQELIDRALALADGC